MLKKFDIIAYKDDQKDAEDLKLAVVKKRPKIKDPKIEICELGLISDDNLTAYHITNKTAEIEKYKIILKLTKVTLKGKNSKFNKFKVDLGKIDAKKLLALKTHFSKDEKKSEEMEEKLTKRRRRRGPLKLEDCYEKMDFSSFLPEGEEEQMEEKVDVVKQISAVDAAHKAKREKDRKMLGSFMRTSTTNLRFELPDFSSEAKISDSPFMFRNSQFKPDKQTVLKTLSQDLNLVFNENRPKKIKFISICQNILKEIDSKYGEKIGVPVDMGLLEKEFVHVPSKTEMYKTHEYLNKVIEYFEKVNYQGEISKIENNFESKTSVEISLMEKKSSMNLEIKENEPSDIEGFLYLIVAQILSFSLRFFMSHENNQLHLLKNKMYLSPFEEDEQTASSRLTALIQSLKKFVKTLKNLLSDAFYNDYLDMISQVTCTIGYGGEQIVEKSEELSKIEKISSKKYLAEIVFDFLKELMNCENSEAQIIDVLKCMLHIINFNKNFILKNKQTVLGKKLNAYYHDRCI